MAEVDDLMAGVDENLAKGGRCRGRHHKLRKKGFNPLQLIPMISSFISIIATFVGFNQIKVTKLFGKESFIMWAIRLFRGIATNKYYLVFFCLFFMVMLVASIGLIHEHFRQGRYYRWASQIVHSAIKHYDQLDGK